jgi:hypothetical protein
VKSCPEFCLNCLASEGTRFLSEATESDVKDRRTLPCHQLSAVSRTSSHQQILPFSHETFRTRLGNSEGIP